MSYQGSQEWLEWRRQGITGTDVSAIMGLNPWKSASDVWREKKGLATDEPDTPNRAMQRGKTLEPIVLDIYEQDKGVMLQRDVVKEHPKYPHHRGSLDALAGEGEHVLEVKCPNLWVYKKIDPRNPIDTIPLHYHLQLQWYLHLVTDAEAGVFVYFCADSWDYKDIPIERDLVLEEEMVDAAEKFWRDYLPKDELPEALVEIDVEAGLARQATSDDAIAQSDEIVRLAGPAWEWLGPEYCAALREYQEAKTKLEELKSSVIFNLHRLGEPKRAEGCGIKVSYSKYTRKSLNTKRLKNEKPDIYKEFLVERPATRLTITPIG